MTPNFESGKAARDAITKAARKRAGGMGRADVKRFVDQADYDRFLCRVFSRPDGRLLLKGGTRMLALVPGARPTNDVDLEARENTLDVAVELLKELASIDLGDWFTFTYRGRQSAGGDSQPEVEATKVIFDVSVAGKPRGTIKVDLALHPRPSAPVVRATPDFRLDIEEFQTFDYAMIATEDQIADKACAMMSVFGAAGEGSSRAKDLVDIAIIALHLRPDAQHLRKAIRDEGARRRLMPFDALVAADGIQAGYAGRAASSPILGEYRSWEPALDLANRLLGPVLSGDVSEGTWDPASLSWGPRAATRG
ncbi:hypothetical protein GCM10025867_50060 (plasmid) [Frondihabitans sucicola]|uniref:Nucleotidyl transferase AbiEii/AbiGii toxin family protein n=1 Tax=Frondihabitans sucicola TaxID=1268041 RepID=A0ABM8GWK9_9MICO|nr:nucleotidyl transferase AbiEii/AbiGii toxin family protein [Frondihabitans sucicola]BDZ52765.1 hypothetical protein GCM10025867_50060 [Frondihabitans sucicola]